MIILLEATVENLKALKAMGYPLNTSANDYLQFRLHMLGRAIQIFSSGNVGIRIISELSPKLLRTYITIEQAAEIRTLLYLDFCTESAYALLSQAQFPALF